MCYIGKIRSPNPSARLRRLWVTVKTSNRGVAVPRAGCVAKNAYKEYFKGFQKSRCGDEPWRIQEPCPGYEESRQGPGRQVLKKQKKLYAKQDCENCRESDRFEGHCFEGCSLQEGHCRQDGCKGCRSKDSASQGHSCWQARCCYQAHGGGARRREKAFDPSSRLQDQRIRGLSRSRRWPDPGHRRAGNSRRQA